MAAVVVERAQRAAADRVLGVVAVPAEPARAHLEEQIAVDEETAPERSITVRT
ncbi:MAG: hypothetical protein IPJ59_00035 [Nannocystis sp.]|nr:hypothetical protein [Nannocystis sp.]MBK7823621.1 hypothetical protein [Nannocystis sp.]